MEITDENLNGEMVSHQNEAFLESDADGQLSVSIIVDNVQIHSCLSLVARKLYRGMYWAHVCCLQFKILRSFEI